MAAGRIELLANFGSGTGASGETYERPTPDGLGWGFRGDSVSFAGILSKFRQHFVEVWQIPANVGKIVSLII